MRSNDNSFRSTVHITLNDLTQRSNSSYDLTFSAEDVMGES